MKAWNILGYTYDADLHCCTCACEHFGHEPTEDDKDSEGNEPHPIFASDEHDVKGEHCGDCAEEIWEPEESPTSEECPECHTYTEDGDVCYPMPR